MADEYAAFYYNNHSVIKSNEQRNFLCDCIHPSMFGKDCEYKLTREANSFEASHSSQTSIIFNKSLHHQEFGDIVCYKTL